jgi:SOS-response transcriptional repressor LexA
MKITEALNGILKRYNSGISRGAQKRLSDESKYSEGLISRWFTRKVAISEMGARDLARVLKVSEDELRTAIGETGSKPSAPSGVDMGTLTRDIPLVPVLGLVSANRFSIAFDAEPIDMVPNPEPSKKLFALKISGDCMFPALRDGEYVYIDPQGVPEDKKVVLALEDGEFTLKRYRIIKGIAWLVPDNNKYPRIKLHNKMTIRGVVAGLYKRDV